MEEEECVRVALPNGDVIEFDKRLSEISAKRALSELSGVDQWTFPQPVLGRSKEPHRLVPKTLLVDDVMWNSWKRMDHQVSTGFGSHVFAEMERRARLKQQGRTK